MALRDDLKILLNYRKETQPMAKIPEMTEVQSSNLHSVGHDGEALYIRFRGKGGVPGRLYRYPTAGVSHHNSLLTAPSPGRHFIANIKGAHAGEAVDG